METAPWFFCVAVFIQYILRRGTALDVSFELSTTQTCAYGVIIDMGYLILSGSLDFAKSNKNDFDYLLVTTRDKYKICKITLETKDNPFCKWTEITPQCAKFSVKIILIPTLVKNDDNVWVLKPILAKAVSKTGSYKIHETDTITYLKPPASFYLEVDGVLRSLTSCVHNFHHQSSHRFMFCSNDLHLPEMTIVYQKVPIISQEPCVTANLEISPGNSTMDMSYKDYCYRSGLYNCLVIVGGMIPTQLPTKDKINVTRPSTRRTSTATGQTPDYYIGLKKIATFTVTILTSALVIGGTCLSK